MLSFLGKAVQEEYISWIIVKYSTHKQLSFLIFRVANYIFDVILQKAINWQLGAQICLCVE
jgi:hypothetical protein